MGEQWSKIPLLYSFCSCRRSRSDLEIVGFFLFWGEDGGRKAAGKKTRVRRSLPGVILHPWLEIARGTNELLTAALSCLGIFAQVESRESSTA